MAEKQQKYFEGIGRRKESVARVRIEQKAKGHDFTVNAKKCDQYFSTEQLVSSANHPLEIVDMAKQFLVTAKVYGGGQTGQAQAVQLGLARALVRFNGDLQKLLSDSGLLKRDPRKKERKKAGLKKARKSPQWSKR